MISGAPASGKGIQCELITTKYDLVHIAAGDLLRAKIAAGTENGRQANEYMDKGQLVPNEIVVTAKLRLHTHHQNMESVLSMYKDITFQVDSSVSKVEVFAQIDGALTQLFEAK